MDEALDDERWIREALLLAEEAARAGDVPVGALVVRSGAVLGRGFNRRHVDQDPLAHAELLAIGEAARANGSWRLSETTLYVTLEPCAMCAGALVNSRVSRLVYGAADPKSGYCGSLGDIARDGRLNHRLDVRGGVLAAECGAMLRSFFRTLRQHAKVP
ncbi:MAG: tRNA adenosine(34) deaminase TadA [Acidobacteriota bacterium]